MQATISTCERCRRRGREEYHYLRKSYIFDVERARVLVSDGREPVELEEDSVRDSVRYSLIDREHVGHVNTAYPGIIAHVFYRTEAGEKVQAQLLIDGNHRAARCLRDQLPYYAYVLTEEESRAILRRGPEKQDSSRKASSDLDAATTRAYADKYAASLPYSRRAGAVCAGATTSDQSDFGHFSVYLSRAEGPRKWDVQGHALVDYVMGQGALLMGHNFEPVTEAVARQASLGTHLGGGHPLEVRWAEQVQSLVPSAERVRFTASGSEATQLALRVARAYTGRARIVRLDQHFHGWHDEALVHYYPQEQAGFNPGAAAQVTLAAPDVAEVVRALQAGDVAAVLLEPGGGAGGALPWSVEELRALREATRVQGALLIFDEAASGFRHSPGGVQQVSGVTPDLTALAKVLAGGLPGGALVGRTKVMAVFGDGTRRGRRLARVPHGGTFNANPLSAAAGTALLERIADGAPQEQASQMAQRLVAGVNALAEGHKVDVCLYTNGTSVFHVLIGARRAGLPVGASPAFTRLYRDEPRRYALWRRALLVAGLDMMPTHGWVSAAHDQVALEESLQSFDRALEHLREVECFRL